MKDNAFEAAIKGIAKTVAAEDLVEKTSEKTGKTYYTTKARGTLLYYVPVPGQPGKVAKAQVNVSVNFTDVTDASAVNERLSGELEALEARRAAIQAAMAQQKK